MYFSRFSSVIQYGDKQFVLFLTHYLIYLFLLSKTNKKNYANFLFQTFSANQQKKKQNKIANIFGTNFKYSFIFINCQEVDLRFLNMAVLNIFLFQVHTEVHYYLFFFSIDKIILKKKKFDTQNSMSSKFRYCFSSYSTIECIFHLLSDVFLSYIKFFISNFCVYT